MDTGSRCGAAVHDDDARAAHRIMAATADHQTAVRHLQPPLPLNADDITLGFIVCSRRAGFRPFDAYDTEIGMEFASRAAIFLDNARLYRRERATALTLQRSLLPTGLSAPASIDQAPYLPGSQLIEVGGDWYESITLPGRGGTGGRRRGRARGPGGRHHGLAAHRDPDAGDPGTAAGRALQQLNELMPRWACGSPTSRPAPTPSMTRSPAPARSPRRGICHRCWSGPRQHRVP